MAVSVFMKSLLQCIAVCSLFRCVCNWCWSWGSWRCQLGCCWWSSSLCGAVAGPWCWHWSYGQHQTDTTAPGVILWPWASGMFRPFVKAWKILQFSLVDSCSILLLLRVWHLSCTGKVVYEALLRSALWLLIVLSWEEQNLCTTYFYVMTTTSYEQQ